MNLTMERVRRPTPAEEQARVDAWNAKNAVGCAVTVRRDDGTELETVTQGPAQLLGGHTAVIWVRGIAGCYALGRCTAMPEQIAKEWASATKRS